MIMVIASSGVYDLREFELSESKDGIYIDLSPLGDTLKGMTLVKLFDTSSIIVDDITIVMD